MYRYDEFDAKFVSERVEQFRDQVERRVSGELTEDCLLYTSPSPRDQRGSRMPSSA